jgi:hypothetical protein
VTVKFELVGANIRKRLDLNLKGQRVKLVPATLVSKNFCIFFWVWKKCLTVSLPDAG